MQHNAKLRGVPLRGRDFCLESDSWKSRRKTRVNRPENRAAIVCRRRRRALRHLANLTDREVGQKSKMVARPHAKLIFSWRAPNHDLMYHDFGIMVVRFQLYGPQLKFVFFYEAKWRQTDNRIGLWGVKTKERGFLLH